jgi:hypothetical protein
MEKDLDYYVSHLESKPLDVYSYTSNFEQSIVYPDKLNPINTTTTEPQKINIEHVSVAGNTYSLWSCIAGIIDDIHLLGTPTMKKSNIKLLTQSLKDYISSKTIHSFLTGRRVYPILELLDKPRVEFEKKHQNAIGYFLSFLIDKSIYVLENEYKWSRDCHDSNMRLSKNKEGYWFVEKIDNV